MLHCLVTLREPLDSLLRERRETLFSLEADRDQVSSVVSSEFEGTSAVDRCTRSLGGTEAPGTLVGTRFPSVNVPVCVFTSVTKCVLQSTHGVSARACVRATPCVSETPRVSVTACVSRRVCVSERVCVRETACVRSLRVREISVGMREHAAASPGVSVMSWCVSLVARGSVCVEWRRRRR